MATEEEIDKLRYSTDSSGNITYTGSVGVSLFDSLPTLEDQLSFWGFTDTEVQNIMNKINAVNDAKSTPTATSTTDPATGNTTANPNGSLVSNSAQSLKNTTEYQQSRVNLEKAKISAMSEANRLRQANLISSIDANRTQEAMLIMQGEQYIQMNSFIDKMTSLTEKVGNLTEHLEAVKTSLAKVATSSTSQAEHYNYLKDGNPELKDSNGNVIKPREVQAKINAEKLIEQEDTNKTTFDDIKDFVGEALGTVGDGLENALGSTDGFDLNFNPLSYIDEILMKDFIENKDNYYPTK